VKTRWGITAGFLFIASGSRAEELPRLRLVVTIDPAIASSCPMSADLTSSIVARLGYDPFTVSAERLSVVDVAPSRRELLARVRLFDAEGAPEGAREVRASPTHCADLFDSVALTVAIAIDPLAMNGPRPQVAEAKPAVPAPSAAPEGWPTAEAPVAPQREEEVDRFGLGVLGALGSAPSPTVGLILSTELGFASNRFHLGMDARADLPASDGTEKGRVVGSLLVADVTGCLGRTFVGCAVLTAGVARVSSSDVGVSRTVYPFFAAAGVRAGMDFPLLRDVAIRPYLEVALVPTRHTLRIDGEERFTFPPFMASAGVITYWLRSR
jgi:hypothetical protein